MLNTSKIPEIVFRFDFKTYLGSLELRIEQKKAELSKLRNRWLFGEENSEYQVDVIQKDMIKLHTEINYLQTEMINLLKKQIITDDECNF